jgi:hypothetical protein
MILCRILAPTGLTALILQMTKGQSSTPLPLRSCLEISSAIDARHDGVRKRSVACSPGQRSPPIGSRYFPPRSAIFDLWLSYKAAACS